MKKFHNGDSAEILFAYKISLKQGHVKRLLFQRPLGIFSTEIIHNKYFLHKTISLLHYQIQILVILPSDENWRNMTLLGKLLL